MTSCCLIFLMLIAARAIRFKKQKEAEPRAYLSIGYRRFQALRLQGIGSSLQAS